MSEIVPDLGWSNNQVQMPTEHNGNIELYIPLIKSKYKNKNDLIFFLVLFTYLLIFLILKKKTNGK